MSENSNPGGHSLLKLVFVGVSAALLVDLIRDSRERPRASVISVVPREGGGYDIVTNN